MSERPGRWVRETDRAYRKATAAEEETYKPYLAEYGFPPGVIVETVMIPFTDELKVVKWVPMFAAWNPIDDEVALFMYEPKAALPELT